MAPRASKVLPTMRQVLARAHRRLILFTVLLAGVTLLFSGLTVIQQYTSHNLKLIAQTVSYTVEPAVVFNDRDALLTGIASVADIDGVRSVEVHDAAGALLAGWARPGGSFDPRLDDVLRRMLLLNPARTSIRHGDQEIGTVTVLASTAVLASYLFAGALISFCCLGITFIATGMLTRRVERDVLVPLERLAAVAHAVRSERDFDRQVPPSGLAEIDSFTSDFNALINELKVWHTGMATQIDDLSYKASHDPLTGLGNRALYERWLDLKIADAVRGELHFAVLFLDVDQFKAVNDGHGHNAGDALLRDIANRLTQCVRGGDQAFRLGGDEFAILTMPVADRPQVENLVERIQAEMRKPFVLPDDHQLSASLSIGTALYPDDDNTAEGLLGTADKSMYRQKDRSRRTEVREETHG